MSSWIDDKINTIQEDIFMARQRKLSPERKAFINSLLKHYQPNDANDVQEMLGDLLGDTLQSQTLKKFGKPLKIG